MRFQYGMVLVVLSLFSPVGASADQAGGLPQIASNTANFLPYETVPLSVSTSSSQVVFDLTQSQLNDSILVANAGTVTAFYVCGYTNGGSTTLTATVPGTNGTVNATPILAGAVMTMHKNTGASNADTCAAITSSGTTTLYFTSGQGQ